MDPQLNGPMFWNRHFQEAVFAIVLLLVSIQPAFSATKPDNAIAITDGKDQFMSTLASMPYTSSGTSPVLYVLECSACPFSQAFEKDWKGRLDGVEMRRLLIAVNAQTAKETAYLARTRDINDFYAFMHQPAGAANIPYPKTGKPMQYCLSISGQPVANNLDGLSFTLKPPIGWYRQGGRHVEQWTERLTRLSRYWAHSSVGRY